MARATPTASVAACDGHDDQGRVDARLRADGVQRVCVASGVRVAHEVDGVPEAGRGRQDRPEPRLRRAASSAATSSPASRAASVAITPSPPPLVTTRRRRPRGQRLAGEAPGQIEELLDAPGPHGAGLPDGRLERGVGAGEGAGVGGDRAAALGRAAGLQEDHGFAGGRRPERLEEAPAVGQPLEVGDDDPGLGIVRGGLQDVGLGQVGLVAEGGEEGEAQAAGARPVEDRGGERARMREERDAAGERHARARTWR